MMVSPLGPILVAIALVALLVAVPLEIAALRRLRRVQLVRGTMFLLSGGIVLLAAAAAALVALNLHTYERLTYEQDAAHVSMRQLGERHFVVTLMPRDGKSRAYEVRGDEWQVDARLLKWRALGNLLGFDTVYRLERLSGRYGDLTQERNAPRTVYALAEDPGLDLWYLLRKHQQYVPLADALYGSAAYVPMAEGAQYAVSVSQSGLVVRPGNDAARKAVGGWK
jgi:hypothetical protein